MLQKSVFNSSKTIDRKALALLTTRSWDSHPGGFFAPLRSLGVTALGRTLIPIQRSACDYAEVSLSLCICHRLPQVAILILTYPLYRSLPRWKIMARSKSTWLGILTPIQGTYPMVQYSVVSVRRRSYIFPFTTTGQRP